VKSSSSRRPDCGCWRSFPNPDPGKERSVAGASDECVVQVLQDVDQLIIDAFVSTGIVRARSEAIQQAIRRSQDAIEKSRALLIEVNVRHALGRPYIGRL